MWRLLSRVLALGGLVAMNDSQAVDGFGMEVGRRSQKTRRWVLLVEGEKEGIL